MDEPENESVASYRARLASLDDELVRLIGERQSLAIKIGLEKQKASLPIRDYARERVVLERAQRAASWQGVSRELVSKLFRLLIESSLRSQERGRVRADATGSGQRALVIGGAGNMGRWFARFLSSQRFEVEIADPAATAADVFPRCRDWLQSALDHDVIVVATPLAQSADCLLELAARRPSGLVVDIASLKKPVGPALRRLLAEGVAVASLHPMFGPDAELLSQRHVVFVDVGEPRALERAKTLFSSTMATAVDLQLDEHDRLMAFVLGLSHATSIAFAAALARSGQSVPALAQASSTTFDAQLEIAERVAAENPDLYYAIQALNKYGDEALQMLEESIVELRSAVTAASPNRFRELMLAGRRYFEDRVPPSEA